MKHSIFSILIVFFLSANLKGQDITDVFVSASDSVYLKATTNYLNERLMSLCPVSSPSWEFDINPPRSIIFYFEVNVLADGSISNVETVNTIFQYNNSKGIIVNDSISPPDVFLNSDECIKSSIREINYVEPIMKDGKYQNSKIPYRFRIGSL